MCGASDQVECSHAVTASSPSSTGASAQIMRGGKTNALRGQGEECAVGAAGRTREKRRSDGRRESSKEVCGVQSAHLMSQADDPAPHRAAVEIVAPAGRSVALQ